MKLVVSDVDGTLLKLGETTPDRTTVTVIRELIKRGILFAVASGRCYSDLAKIFQEIRQDIIFIANDGAAVFYKENMLCRFPIDHTIGFSFMKDIYQYTEAEVVLYGGKKTFILPKEKDFERLLLEWGGESVQIVQCMNRVQEDYLKIACYHKTDIREQLEAYLPYWREQFHIPYCSKNWMEFTSCGVHKATAVEKLLEFFHIQKTELLVFGDNENDKELLSMAEFSYAMKGAKAEIKQLCAYETENVAETITSLCLKAK